MVRFSDLLGGNDDAEEPRPATVSAPSVTQPAPPPVPELDNDNDNDSDVDTDADPFAALATEASPIDPVASPEDVLDRLTQYATSARAGDQVPETPVAAPDPSAEVPTTEDTRQEFRPVGDDLLPRSGGAKKSGRGRKRRP